MSNTWSAYLTPEQYHDLYGRVVLFCGRHFEGLPPEDIEDLAHDAMVGLLAKGTVLQKHKNPWDQFWNRCFYRSLYTICRDNSQEPLLRAKGFIYRNNGMCIEQTDLVETAADPHIEIWIARRQALHQIDDAIRQIKPKSFARYQRVWGYILSDVSRSEISEREKVSYNRAGNILVVLRTALRSAYLMGLLDSILDIYQLPFPSEEARISKPLPDKGP